MTVTEIRTSVSKTLLEGNGWPPSLPEFVSLGKGSVDYDAAYFRCLNKSPQGRVETWVYENAYYNIKSAADDKARRMHRKFMSQAEDLEREGKLQNHDEMLKALPVHSVKNLNDLVREEYQEKHENELHPRIKKLLGK